jgi:hypothetical protein
MLQRVESLEQFRSGWAALLVDLLSAAEMRLP